MTEDLPRTPEGDLIRRARERAAPKLSIRAAAARIGISPEHWGNIERGYKSAGEGKPPRPLDDVSAALIAKMARAVGITPEQMANEGRRPDAAEEMRAPAPAPAPGGEPEVLAEIFSLLVDPLERRLAESDLTPEEKIRAIRALRELNEKHSSGDSGTGRQRR